MSPALALTLHAAAFLLTAVAATRVIRWWHAHRRARDRARLPEQMHLLGPRWARQTIRDIHALPTTRERGNQ